MSFKKVSKKTSVLLKVLSVLFVLGATGLFFYWHNSIDHLEPPAHKIVFPIQNKILNNSFKSLIALDSPVASAAPDGETGFDYCDEQTNTLTIDVEGPGSTNPSAGTHTYDYGESVNITANPDSGAGFLIFSGEEECYGPNNPCQLEMIQDRVVTAYFSEDGGAPAPTPEPTTYELTVSSTTGGSVLSPGEGTYTYDEGETVTLEANSDWNYDFDKWAGDTSNIDNQYSSYTTIVMDGDHSITAEFSSSSGGGWLGYNY